MPGFSLKPQNFIFRKMKAQARKVVSSSLQQNEAFKHAILIFRSKKCRLWVSDPLCNALRPTHDICRHANLLFKPQYDVSQNRKDNVFTPTKGSLYNHKLASFGARKIIFMPIKRQFLDLNDGIHPTNACHLNCKMEIFTHSKCHF